MRKLALRTTFALGLVFVSVTSRRAPAADWPRLWGPEGNASAKGAAPFASQPALKGKELWRRSFGSGYSEIAIAGDRGFSGLSDGTNDNVVAFDPATGKEIWRTKLGPSYRGHDGSHDGPVSSPTVDRGQVFLVSPNGLLVALDAASGKSNWQHDLKTEYEAPAPFYGFGTSPHVSGDLVIVQAGGPKNNLLAFERATGKLAWSVQHSAGVGYSSPVPATLAGVAQIVVYGSDKLLGIKAADGSLLWSHPAPAGNEASRSPLVFEGDRVLLPLGSEIAVLKVSKDGDKFSVAELWKNNRIKSTFSPTVYHQGHLYGFNGTYLVCLDAATGDLKWREKTYDGALILVDGHLVVLGQKSGNLHVAAASPAGYREKLKMRVFTPGAPSYTGPTYRDGRVYLRNVEEIVALELAGQDGAAGSAKPASKS